MVEKVGIPNVVKFILNFFCFKRCGICQKYERFSLLVAWRLRSHTYFEIEMNFIKFSNFSRFWIKNWNSLTYLANSLTFQGGLEDAETHLEMGVHLYRHLAQITLNYKNLIIPIWFDKLFKMYIVINDHRTYAEHFL